MATQLTIYFDGNCVFCAMEMKRLARWDRARAKEMAFVDIAEPGFDPAPLGVDMAALDREIHSLTADGRVLVGIDTLIAAYTLVGLAWAVAPLRLRVLRPLISSLYRGFARHRYQISDFLGLSKTVPACETGVCQRKTPFL